MSQVESPQEAADRSPLPGGADQVERGPRVSPRAKSFVAAYAFVALFVIVLAFFSVLPATNGNFFQASTLRTIAITQGPLLIIAVGMVIPLTAGHFDLSVAATAGVSSVTVASVVAKHGQSIWLGIGLAIVFALAIGLVNGFLVAKVGTSPFVTTLAMSTLLAGLLQLATASLPITAVYPASFTGLGTATWLGGIPWSLLLVVPLIAVAFYVLHSTPYGRNLHAIGSNSRAAKLVGVPVVRTALISFLLSALMGAAAGILMTAQAGGADPGVGGSYLFPAFTALFLGMTTIRPGRPNVIGTVLAVLFIAASVSGLTMSGADAWVRDVFEGGALLLAVCVATVFAKGSAAGKI
jgi:ribose transport system permease protein